MSAQDKGSALEQVRKLREQADKLMDEAKAEALGKVEKGIEDLNSLGFHYRLVEAEEPARRTREKVSARQKSDGPCPICNFKTDPAHDGRRHRSQEPKKPFTAAELKEMSITKVE